MRLNVRSSTTAVPTSRTLTVATPLRVVAALCLLAAALSSGASVAGAQVTIKADPWGAREVQRFDPKEPPTDPPLRPGEDADAGPVIAHSPPNVTFGWNRLTNTLTVKSADLTISGHTVIRLPTDATPRLVAHEFGHDELICDDYNTRALAKFQEEMKRGGDFAGMTFTGVGVTDADRQDDAFSKALAELERRFDAGGKAYDTQQTVLNQKYDDITDHGRPAGKSASEGVKEALEERAKAPAAGDHGYVPIKKNGYGAVGDPPMVTYDRSTDRLSFGGNLVMDDAFDPSDPIIGRGRLQIQDLLPIGPMANGAIHLTDARLQIFDLFTSTALMNAFLFEPAYMPSSLPGYAGMIQGYLDVPQDFAGGVRNTIGSPFLAAMQANRDAGALTMFWFYTDQQLFDAQGNVVATSVTGSAKLATATPVPEPGTLSLCLLGLLTLTLVARPWRRVCPTSGRGER